MNILAIIPARAGSKRVPQKNFRPFVGTTLTELAIRQALGSTLLTHIALSSDSEEVLAIGRKYPQITCLQRPAEISGDDAPAIDYVRHALATLENTPGFVNSQNDMNSCYDSAPSLLLARTPTTAIPGNPLDNQGPIENPAVNDGTQSPAVVGALANNKNGTQSPAIAAVLTNNKDGTQSPAVVGVLANNNDGAQDFAQSANFSFKTPSRTPFDIVVILQPSSPLRTSEDIDATIQLLLDNPDADSAVSVVKLDHMVHPLKLKTLEGNELRPFLEDEAGRFAAQDLPDVYVRNCAVYATWRRDLDTRPDVIGQKSLAYLMPPERSVDINEWVDFEFGEYLYTNIK